MIEECYKIPIESVKSFVSSFFDKENMWFITKTCNLI